MWLPIITIAIIVVVSILLISVITVGIVRSKCCKTNDKDIAKDEAELDRFLSTEESEDEKHVASIKSKISHQEFESTYNESLFHFADTHVEENPYVKNTSAEIKCDTDVDGLDEVVVIENVDIVNVNDPVKCTVEEIPAMLENSSTSHDDNCFPTPSLLVESTTAGSPATLMSLAITDNRIVTSDDASTVSNSSNIRKNKKKRKLIGLKRSQRNSGTFSADAKLQISLQYIESVKCLKGCIVAIEGLNIETENCPHEINFHLRFFPNKRFHISTKFKPILDEDTPLNLTFTMGPVFSEDLKNNTLRVKLYGKRSQRIGRSRCYGECTYSLQQVIGKSEPVKFEAFVIQREGGSIIYSSDSDGVL